MRAEWSEEDLKLRGVAKHTNVQLCDLFKKVVGEDIVERPLLPYRCLRSELLWVLQPPTDSVAELVDLCTRTHKIDVGMRASREATRHRRSDCTH